MKRIADVKAISYEVEKNARPKQSRKADISGAPKGKTNHVRTGLGRPRHGPTGPATKRQAQKI